MSRDFKPDLKRQDDERYYRDFVCRSTCDKLAAEGWGEERILSMIGCYIVQYEVEPSFIFHTEQFRNWESVKLDGEHVKELMRALCDFVDYGIDAEFPNDPVLQLAWTQSKNQLLRDQGARKIIKIKKQIDGNAPKKRE